MDRADILQQTRAYIVENFLYTRPDVRLGDEDRLLEKGIIDSMGVMELVSFLQERFAIAVDEAEITEDHFGSLVAISAFVAAKRAGSRAA